MDDERWLDKVREVLRRERELEERLRGAEERARAIFTSVVIGLVASLPAPP